MSSARTLGLMVDSFSFHMFCVLNLVVQQSGLRTRRGGVLEELPALDGDSLSFYQRAQW